MADRLLWRSDGKIYRVGLPPLPAARVKLFLKGDKCFGPKCPVERRNYALESMDRGGERFRITVFN